MMLFRPLSKFAPKRILFITLSNVGDVILTLPVFDFLKHTFPDAHVSVVVGPKAESLLHGNPHIDELIIFNKRMPIIEKLGWWFNLRKQCFDVIVDLRQTILPIVLRTTYATWPRLSKFQGHMKDKHLSALQTLWPHAKRIDQTFGADFPDENLRMPTQNPFVIVAPGAADHRKEWGMDHYIKLTKQLTKQGLDVVLVGDNSDQKHILKYEWPEGVISMAGQTLLRDLIFMFQQAKGFIGNDSGLMHLASYLNLKTVAIFGPTDSSKYGPWSKQSILLHPGFSTEDVKGAFVWDAVKALEIV